MAESSRREYTSPENCFGVSDRSAQGLTRKPDARLPSIHVPGSIFVSVRWASAHRFEYREEFFSQHFLPAPRHSITPRATDPGHCWVRQIQCHICAYQRKSAPGFKLTLRPIAAATYDPPKNDQTQSSGRITSNTPRTSPSRQSRFGLSLCALWQFTQRRPITLAVA